MFITEIAGDSSPFLKFDVIDGASAKRMEGNVRIFDVEKNIHEYNGDLLFVPLLKPLDVATENAVKEQIRAEHVRNPGYDYFAGMGHDTARLSVLDLFFKPKEGKENYFCAEEYDSSYHFPLSLYITHSCIVYFTTVCMS